MDKKRKQEIIDRLNKGGIVKMTEDELRRLRKTNGNAGSDRIPLQWIRHHGSACVRRADYIYGVGPVPANAPDGDS